MNFSRWLQGITAGTIALSGLAVISPSNVAQTSNYTFYCGTSSDGVPTTYAAPPSGRKVAVIRWQRDWGGEYTPEVRCQKVSARFQELSRTGYLNYLTTGIKNGQPVICGTRRYGDTCTQVLFTVRAGDNADKLIQDLMGIGARASGPLVQSADGSPKYYYDMNLFLDNAAGI